MVRWIKQQDFCLRLGLLRALIALLPQHGRSVDRSVLLRRLNQVLFQRLRGNESLDDAAAMILGERADEALISGSESGRFATIADGLLVTSGSPSWGQPIDHRTAPKILEWATLCGLIGAGNQITERGEILRGLLPAPNIGAFGEGDVGAWNPFVIPPIERAYFFYHLGELDEVLWLLAFAVGQFDVGAEITPGVARELTSKAINNLVMRVSRTAPMNEMPRVRIIAELASVIEAELVGVTSGSRSSLLRRGPPRSIRSGQRPGTIRRTTKNADHQTIPRFELLVDCGFLAKPASSTGGRALWKERNAWSFMVTPMATEFAKYLQGCGVRPVAPWQWAHFAHAWLQAHTIPKANTAPGEADVVVSLFLECYSRVRRRAGHTPFESAALLTCLTALSHGTPIEIGVLHRAFLELKISGELGKSVHFAAGNEIDRMFIHLQPTAREPIRTWFRSHWPRLAAVEVGAATPLHVSK